MYTQVYATYTRVHTSVFYYYACTHDSVCVLVAQPVVLLKGQVGLFFRVYVHVSCDQ